MNDIEGTDIGYGFTIHTFRTSDSDEPVGAIIEGPAAEQCLYKNAFTEGRCAGSIRWSTWDWEGLDPSRPIWELVQEEPLSLQPSIQCKCQGQHGYITDGKYVPA